MKTFQQLSSVMMMTAAAAVIGIPALQHPPEWRVMICELDTFLLAFTLACTAILLWPRSELAPAKR
jgi:hypothetical protein